MEQAKKIARKHIRYRAEPQHFAQVDTTVDGAEFKFRHVAVIVDESAMSGCSIVCHKDIGLKRGDHCRIKLGELAPYKAEIVWLKELDDQIIRMGCKFLE